MNGNEMDEVVDEVTITLRGFTIEELKRIAKAIREVENRSPDKFAFIFVDDKTLTYVEAAKLAMEIWPP